MFSYQTKQKERIGATVQPKLKIGQPGDKYEQDADAVADRVMNMNQSETMQMQPVEEEEEVMQPKLRMQPIEEEEMLQPKIQMKSEENHGSINSNKGLPKETQMKMESAFGEDFSNVEISQNSKQADDLNALAYTQGESIHFATGQFNPQSKSGQELIGHELTHVVQQRHGRVNQTAQLKGMSINQDKKLENEADTLGKKAANSSLDGNGYSKIGQTASVREGSGVAQFALPAVIAAMGAAEWLAAGGLGYLLVNDAVSSGSGDVSYSFDEVEGVLLPGGGNDVAAHKTANPSAQIYEATHKFAIWGGKSGSRKMGIKFGITYLFDNAGAIGNISLSLIDVYDWPGWGGTVNVNITPRSLARGNASFRFTINVGYNNSWFVSENPGSVELILRGGDGDLSLIVDNFYGYTEIS